MKAHFQDWGVRICTGFVCVRSGSVESCPLVNTAKDMILLFTNQFCDHRILKKDSVSWT
jgi:hypothetical protein